MKLGGNLFTVQQDAEKNELVIGSVRSPLKFTLIKDAEGKPKYTKVSTAFREKGKKAIYEIPCVMSKEVEVSEGELMATFESGESIASFFMPCPMGTGGGNWIDMRELEIGEYAIVDVEEGEPHPEYGRKFMVTMADGRKFDVRGSQPKNIFARNLAIYQAALNKGKPLTFSVTSKEELPQGVAIKVSVQVREPRTNLALPASVGVAQLAPAPEKQKQLVAAAANVATNGVNGELLKDAYW